MPFANEHQAPDRGAPSSLWQQPAVRHARTAYILLWFPKPSETFVFREVTNLRKCGLPLLVFTLYGPLHGGFSEEMQAASPAVERLGTRALARLLWDALRRWWRDPARVSRLLLTVPWRRWGGIARIGENVWAILCAFHLARRFEEERIEHIHAPWANGPATAAWIASRLTAIPFSFTGRAFDIYPPDGGLPEKIRAAHFVRCEMRASITHLAGYCSVNDAKKIHLTYNGVPLLMSTLAPVPMQPPFRLLALGRFVHKKGFGILLYACRMLADDGMDFHLTLAGDGPQGPELRRLARKLGLGPRVSFPGFLPYDDVPALFQANDLFVMPSIIEPSSNRDGIPTVIIEALFHRLPVIASNVSGIPEVIEHGVTGLLVPEQDPQALALAVRQATSDRSAALAMADRGRARAMAMFDPERNHHQVLELYRSQLAS